VRQNNTIDFYTKEFNGHWETKIDCIFLGRILFGMIIIERRLLQSLYYCVMLALSSRALTTRAFTTAVSRGVGRGRLAKGAATFNHQSSSSLGKRFHWSEYYKSSTGVFLLAEEEGGSSAATETVDSKSVDSKWNVVGLKKEVSRATVRCHKKVGKANQRLQKANEEVDRLTSDPDVSLEEMEKCPNIEGLEADLEELRTRLTRLNKLEVLLQDVKGKNTVLPEHVAELALQLEVNDEPPKREAQVKKEKGPRNMTSFRRPYRRFYTVNKTEIRVRILDEMRDYEALDRCEGCEDGLTFDCIYGRLASRQRTMMN
jgi:hypothetical protein